MAFAGLLIVLVSASSAPAGLPGDVNLASAANVVRIDGPATGADFGDGGIVVGDLDGDGTSDLVVCAPEALATRGEAYVIFGVPGVGLTSRDLATNPPDVIIAGAGSNARLGVSAAAADMDGDGADELLLATGGYLPALGRRASGGVLIFRGGARLRGVSHIDLSIEVADAAAFDPTVPAPIGVSLVTGDFDGDGYADLAAGAPLATGLTGADKAGRVAVVFGDPFFPGGQAIDVENDGRSAIVGGLAAGDQLGSDLLAADVTGDRVDDLVMGTPNRTVIRVVTHEKAGEVFVLDGTRLVRRARVDLATGAAFVRVFGSDFGDFLGRGIGAGDVTGDGRMDLAAGAIDADGVMNGRFPDCGEVYVVELPDPTDSTVILDIGDDVQTQTVIGPAPLRFVGNNVVVADVDGDRQGEVIATSEGASGPNGTQSGILYVVDGRPGTLDLASMPANGTVYGPSSGAKLGSRLTSGDVDGDGAKDIVVTAPGATGGRGAVFIVFGHVTEANAAPVLGALPDVTAATGQLFQLTFAATDPDGDPLRFSVAGRPIGSLFRDAGNGTATLTHVPPVDSSGIFQITVTASDGLRESSDTFELTLVGANPPSIRKVKFKRNVLKVTGDRFSPTAVIFINDVQNVLPVEFNAAKGRLTVRGTRGQLSLMPGVGTNRLVVRVDGVSTTSFVF